jgi:hypothetical protein
MYLAKSCQKTSKQLPLYSQMRSCSRNLPKTIPEDKLPEWQHPVDKKEIPIELKQMRQAVMNELVEKEKIANEIIKNPDWQFYHTVLQQRIELVEQEIMEKRKYNKETMKIVDRAIDDVINKTKEDFYHYYKARDERYMALIEERLESLPAGDKEWESESIQYLLDGDTKIQDEEENEIRLLTEGTGVGNPFLELEDDEPDTDEIVDEVDDDNSTWNKKIQKIEEDVKNKTRFNTSYDPLNQKGDPLKGPLYTNYENLGIYKKELPDSPFAPVDRIMAHFQARNREQINTKVQLSEQEEMKKFMEFLGKDDEARDEFMKLSEEHKNFGPDEFGDLIIPEAGRLEEFDKKMLVMQKKEGISSDTVKTKDLYEKVNAEKRRKNAERARQAAEKAKDKKS